MSEPGADRKKGYFEALTAAAFKTGRDGRTLFFPWGIYGRGYVIASEQDDARLRRQIKTWLIVGMTLGIGAGVAKAYALAALIVAGWIAAYAIWLRRLLRSLQPSDEKMTRRESMQAQAITHTAGMLWFLEITALAFVAIGIFLLLVEPAQWLIGVSSILLFGLAAFVIAYMLVLRHRAMRASGSPQN